LLLYKRKLFSDAKLVNSDISCKKKCTKTVSSDRLMVYANETASKQQFNKRVK